MKLYKAVVALGAALALFGAAGCSSGDSGDATNSAGVAVIKVGAAPTPHAKILEFINENLAEEAGIRVEIAEYTDESRLNQYLNDGDIDANFFQHLPYLESQVEEFGYKIQALPGVHIEPYGLYSEKHDSLQDLPDGATIALTNDPVNLGRALDLLEQGGVIEVKDTGDEDPTVLDVTGNPKNLKFVETDPAQLVRSLADVDGAIISGNYALDGGLNPSEDSLLLESGENNPYANFLTIRTEDADDANLKKLNDLLHSSQVREFIKSTWPDGQVIPAF